MRHSAKNVGQAIALSMVEDFINHPEWRGKNFTWENLPYMCASHAATGFHLPWNNSTWKARRKAAEEAFRVAQDLLIEEGFLSNVEDFDVSKVRSLQVPGGPGV